MKSLAPYKRAVAKVRRDWQDGRYEQALAEVDRLLAEWPDNPQLLVMRADLIQLQDANGPSLQDAKATYQRAAELGDEFPPALVELGHFLYAVEVNARDAKKIFEKAAGVCRRLFVEAQVGRAKALQELDRPAEARACLDEAYLLLSRDPKVSNGELLSEVMGQLNELVQAG